MSLKLDEHTGILVKKAARLFEQVANKNLDVLGVTYAQTIFLVRLWEKDGLNQLELTRSAGLKQPTVVRILDKMERDKLVTRVRNKEDKRVYNFFLTEKAKKACRKLEEHANAMHDVATVNIPKKEIRDFNLLIGKIIENLEKTLT